MRGVIKNILYTPEPENVRTDADPMDPMGDTPEARTQRFRKFLCTAFKPAKSGGRIRGGWNQ